MNNVHTNDIKKKEYTSVWTVRNIRILVMNKQYVEGVQRWQNLTWWGKVK